MISLISGMASGAESVWADARVGLYSQYFQQALIPGSPGSVSRVEPVFPLSVSGFVRFGGVDLPRADLATQPLGWLGMGARVTFDLQALDVSEAAVWLDVRKLAAVPLSVDYSYQKPSLLLPSTSVLAAFGGASWHELGAEATVRALESLHITGRGAGQLVEGDQPGGRAQVQVRTECDSCHASRGVSGAMQGGQSPHSFGWASGLGAAGNSHGPAARRDIGACASCRDQGPWMKTVQRRFEDEEVPGGAAKRALYEVGCELLLAADYKEIGLDHFALERDGLWKASAQGRMHRNFMGYTDRSTMPLFALGTSAIGDTWTSFAQNEKSLPQWHGRVAKGEFPIAKGHLLDAEDLVLRRLILELMTRFETRWEPGALPWLETVPAKLVELAHDGLVEVTNTSVKVTAAGQPFVRNVCMALDARLARQAPDRPLFSRTV